MHAHLLALGATTPPRAILGRFAANGDPKKILAELTAGFEEFRDRYDGYADNVKAAIDDVNARIAAMQLGGVGAVDASSAPVDPTYTRPFAQWFRTGHGEEQLREANASGERARIQAAMSVGDNSSGGYLAPVEWDRTVSKRLIPASPLRRIANVITTRTAGYKQVWNAGGWGSGWVGETASRPTTTTPTLAEVVFKAGEVYANPTITQQLLDDAGFDIEAWLAGEIAETFALQEGIAYISGDGINKPKGLLTYVDPATPAHPGGNLVTINSGAAAALTGDGLIALAYGLPATYRQNARWLMSSITAAAIAKLKDGQGNYLWRDNYQVGQPPSLLGFPVELDENMPAIAAGNTPIAFGDFKRGYTINDRTGLRILRDPYTVKGYVGFYATRRVGGGVSDPNAVVLQKVAA